jgi:hypothetical protein
MEKDVCTQVEAKDFDPLTPGEHAAAILVMISEVALKSESESGDLGLRLTERTLRLAKKLQEPTASLLTGDYPLTSIEIEVWNELDPHHRSHLQPIMARRIGEWVLNSPVFGFGIRADVCSFLDRLEPHLDRRPDRDATKALSTRLNLMRYEVV